MSLFGCQHERITWPQTRKRRTYVSGIWRLAGTFVCCLDCGKEFAYDWNEMRITGDSEKKAINENVVEA